jgi:hypothetical protein
MDKSINFGVCGYNSASAWSRVEMRVNVRGVVAVGLVMVGLGMAPRGVAQGVAVGGAQAPFKTAVYIPVSVVLKMRDRAWLESSWAQLSSQVHVDKVYIETYRSRVQADGPLIEEVKKFFASKGVEVAGGICYSDSDNGQFVSFTYSRAEDRAYVKKMSAFTARHFDEVILDDFFFANTKAASDIAAKGKEDWTDFRMKEMDDVSRELVVGAMREANPKVKVTIKFPNWYEHFAANGYDLQEEPKIFDGIYAGTETRDPEETDQNLQQYEGYEIVQYFEHVDPGMMGGGWVDTYDVRYVDRYAEQLWLTVFGKAKEMTLFNYIDLLKEATAGERAWGDEGDVSWKKIETRAGSAAPTFASVAGDALDQVKPFVGELGKPMGIASYRPYHAVGEDFLHNFLGMIGIPIDLSPVFPKEAPVVLLTEAAKSDPRIVEEMKAQLLAGKTVVMTSGLLKALEGKGIEDVVGLRYSAVPVAVTNFIGAYGPGAGTPLGDAAKPVLIPQVRFYTNDAWPVIRGLADGNGFPMLLMDEYGAGKLYVLTVPDNFADLYQLPEAELDALRSYMMGDFPVRIDAPAKVSLFAYDNGSLVVESFRDEPVEVTVRVKGSVARLENLRTGAVVEGTMVEAQGGRRSAQAPRSREEMEFKVTLPAHSYVALKEVE